MLKHDKEPDTWEQVEFEIDIRNDVIISDLNEPAKMTVRVRQAGFLDTKTSEVDLASIINYTELEKALTPEALLHERPCFLTSEQTYKIVRAYIEDNINGAISRITSDYDFCFTVKKKVAIKPWIKQREIMTARGRSYRPPKFVTSKVESREIEIFEMTHANAKYAKYTVIEGFRGDNYRSLAENIKTYLDELMEFINQPVVECQTCQGCGHIFPDKFPLNERAA